MVEVKFNNKLSGLFPKEKDIYHNGHYSALVKGGNVIGYANSSLAGKSRYCREAGRSCHAEIALLKFLTENNSKKMNKYIVWNIRWTREGKITNAKPCLNCQRTLHSVGIKTIIFSTSEGTFVKHNIEDIKCLPSSGFRY